MIDFVDLHAHTSYSTLDGHPDPDQVVEKAVALGRRAHAITDHGGVSGHVLFEKAIAGYRNVKTDKVHSMRTAEDVDLKPIYGMEAYTVADAKGREAQYQKKNHLSILAKTQVGYKNLLQLVTLSFAEGFYYRQAIDGEMLLDHREGLIILSGCESGQFMRKIEAQDWDGARELARTWKSVFGDDFYIELQHFPHVSAKAAWGWAIAEEQGIKAVLTCDSHYLDPDGWKYQQFLWSIRDGKPVDDFKIEYAYMWAPDELFAFCARECPQVDWRRVFENTMEVAEKVEHFQLPKAPHVRYPMEGDKIAIIGQMCLQFLQQRGCYTDAYLNRLKHELDVIAGKEYEDYFLVVADMVQWAKSQGIFVGPARGSSAGSLVCWCLRITEIDPLRYGLLFERFVDPTRTDLPDIDVDFEDQRREEVFAYMARRYGEECVARISTFMRLGGRSALDDAQRSYRIPQSDIDLIKRHLVDRSSGDQRAELTIHDTLEEFPEAKEVYERYPALEIAAGCQGKIRGLGKHAAGLIVTSEPVGDYCAIYKSGETRLIAVDWRDSQHLNLMKIDCLGLKELSLIRMISAARGWTLQNVYDLPMDDAETIRGFNEHDFLGIFQYTGLATKGVASRVFFDSIQQIADVNALSRPGPLHAGATEKYLQGRASGQYVPILPQRDVQPIIAPTYGQIIYQEQVMRILREVGGMTWQDVCDIRNIMGKSKGSEAFDKFWPKWEAGTAERGHSSADARQIWECIRLYGKHSFNLAHSVSYGVVAYISMFMKRHFPREFYWAQLAHPTTQDEVQARFIGEAIRRGITFAPYSLALTGATWTLGDDGRSISPGWMSIKGIGDAAGQELARHAPFADLADVEKRCNRRVVNVKIRRLIEEHLGKTVEELYGLDRWVEVDRRFPQRHQIIQVNEGMVDGQSVTVGRVTRINKKNRLEEYRTKGRDTAQLVASGKPTDYVILILQDDTDSMMVYVTPENYARWHQAIWTSEGTFIKVVGQKVPGVQLVNAKMVEWNVLNQELKGVKAYSFADVPTG